MQKRKDREEKYETPAHRDLVIHLKSDGLQCSLDSSLHSPEEAEKIKRIVESVSRDVVIDKSYVKFDGNKHEKTFLLESGWNALCETICDVFDGRCKKSVLNDPIIMDAYKQMLVLYTSQVLEDFGIKAQDIVVYMKPKSKLKAEFFEDSSQAWRDYPGKWQTWHSSK